MKRPGPHVYIIEADPDGGYVARCVGLGIASQGETIEQTRANVIEAVELFYEFASAAEIRRTLGLE
jgi:predicted RNase H-like HicB family nuclease